MSVLSSTFRPASGLENATIGQKLDCSKEKIVSGIKFGIAQGAVAGLGTMGMTAALTSDKFAKAGAKVVDTLVKPDTQKGLKEVGKEIINAVKKNPKGAKAFALVTGITLAASTVLGFADIRKNGKIEGKHQERVDNTNQNKKEA